MIKVLRTYLSYDISSVSTFTVKMNVTIKVTEKEPFILLPIKGYRADLKATDSENNELIILSDKEFSDQMGFSMDVLNKQYIEKWKEKLKSHSKKLAKNFRLVAIWFSKDFDEYYEKLTITWNEQIEKEYIKNDGYISELANLPIFIQRLGSPTGSTSSMYLSVKVDPKYVIKPKPKFSNLNLASDKIRIETILNDERHKVFRFEDVPKTQLFKIGFMISRPDDVKGWLKVGLYSGTIPPIVIVGISLATHEVPRFGFEVLGGIIAFLIGERAFIFQDSILMKKWNRVIIGLAIIVSIILLVLISLSAGVDNLKL